ncbi:hypothetical protein Tco_1393487 [Tanacetum coccineum]
MSFSKRSETASHNNKTLKKDPHPTLTEFNAEVCNFPSNHTAPFQKFLEPFLCFVGISCYFEFDDYVYPVFLIDDDEEMDLFAFINHADPTKVRVGEKQIEEGQTPLLESTRGRLVPLASVDDQGDQNDDVQDDGNQNDNVQDVDHDVNKEGVDAGQENPVEASIVYIEDEVPAIVAEKAKGSRRKRKAAKKGARSVTRSLVLDPSIMTTDFATTVVDDISSVSVPRAGDELVHASILGISPLLMDFETLQQIYVPKWDMVNDYALDDVEICHSIVDQLAPHIFFSQLCSIDYEVLYHERRKSVLESKVVALESVDATKVAELASLTTQTAKLTQYFSELGYKLFKEQIEVVHVIYNQVAFSATRGLRLVGEIRSREPWKAGRGLVDVAAYNPSAEANYVSAVNALCDVDFPLLAQLESQKDASIAEQHMLLIHRSARCPAAKTPKANQLQPSPEKLMLPIHRDDASRCLSLSDAMVPLIDPLSSENLVGEASTSRVLATATTSALSTTFIQTRSVPPISVADYEVLGAGPSTEVPSLPKIVFEKEELETTPEHTTAP